jgi:phosphatidylglycerophosphate synthase
VTAGETWTRELLAELRARRFRPAAWQVCFGRSFERAAETRARRARDHRRLKLLAAAGLAGWAVVALLGRPWLGVGGAAWLLAMLLMVDWHLAMLEDDEGRPLPGIGVPNLLGIGRGALVPLLLAVPAPVLLTLLALAGASDVIDGWLARAWHYQSRLGRFLDGGVDALVLGAAAIATARLGLLPWWTATLVLARYLLQWSALTFAYFLGLPIIRAVPGRAAGLVLFGGLALALLQVGGATVLVAMGAVAGMAVLARNGDRSLRPQTAAAGSAEARQLSSCSAVPAGSSRQVG